MRIKLTFDPVEGHLKLPVAYNHIIQSLIYRHIGELADELHDGGYRYGKRSYKLFTFSRMRATEIKYNRDDRTLTFSGKIWIYIASLKNDLLESLTLTMVRNEIFELKGQPVRIASIEVEMPVEYRSPMLIKMMSPVTVYSTLMTPDNRKKTYFYTPWEDEFSELVVNNLVRKFKAVTSDEPPDVSSAYIKPIRVDKHDLVITRFKGYLIKGWKGVYELNLPPPYFEIAYNTGIGSKNSQGFGMFRIVGMHNDGE